MRITRIYTGSDGRSHFEDLEIPAADATGRGPETELIANAGAILRDRRNAKAIDMDFHNAPRRQLVVPIGGHVEVEVGDGTVRRFASGEVLFADDLTGQGHRTRSSDELTRMIFVVMPDDFDAASWRIAAP